MLSQRIQRLTLTLINRQWLGNISEKSFFLLLGKSVVIQQIWTPNSWKLLELVWLFNHLLETLSSLLLDLIFVSQQMKSVGVGGTVVLCSMMAILKGREFWTLGMIAGADAIWDCEGSVAILKNWTIIELCVTSVYPHAPMGQTVRYNWSQVPQGSQNSRSLVPRENL